MDEDFDVDRRAQQLWTSLSAVRGTGPSAPLKLREAEELLKQNPGHPTLTRIVVTFGTSSLAAEPIPIGLKVLLTIPSLQATDLSEILRGHSQAHLPAVVYYRLIDLMATSDRTHPAAQRAVAIFDDWINEPPSVVREQFRQAIRSFRNGS